jgi:hypothetical protein
MKGNKYKILSLFLELEHKMRVLRIKTQEDIE